MTTPRAGRVTIFFCSIFVAACTGKLVGGIGGAGADGGGRDGLHGQDVRPHGDGPQMPDLAAVETLLSYEYSLDGTVTRLAIKEDGLVFHFEEEAGVVTDLAPAPLDGATLAELRALIDEARSGAVATIDSVGGMDEGHLLVYGPTGTEILIRRISPATAPGAAQALRLEYNTAAAATKIQDFVDRYARARMPRQESLEAPSE